MYSFSEVQNYDPDLAKAMADETQRQRDILTSVVRNTFRKEVPTGAMEGEEVMCISVVTGITGRSFT